MVVSISLFFILTMHQTTMLCCLAFCGFTMILPMVLAMGRAMTVVANHAVAANATFASNVSAVMHRHE
jgi:hypothetical protein